VFWWYWGLNWGPWTQEKLLTEISKCIKRKTTWKLVNVVFLLNALLGSYNQITNSVSWNLQGWK
jgi:hypothetical protein